jgi:hypothetical protein
LSGPAAEKETLVAEARLEVERTEERSSHAIYGLIIITATLVADREHAETALISMLVLWGAALVLVLAHIYSGLIAELGTSDRRLTYAERHVLVIDNIPVAASVLLPTILLVAAGLGLMDLRVAIDLSILLSVASLFAVGLYQAREQGAPIAHQLSIGALGAALGVFVIIAEVTLSH